eukprot:1145177-Pelagomonas_calceolata.AAC.2
MSVSHRAQLLAEAHHHIKTASISAIVIDGNSSSVRDRCQCLNKSYLQGHDVLLGPRDADAIFYHKFCLGTPVRKDPEGCCQECVASDKHPTRDMAARSPAVTPVVRTCGYHPVRLPGIKGMKKQRFEDKKVWCWYSRIGSCTTPLVTRDSTLQRLVRVSLVERHNLSPHLLRAADEAEHGRAQVPEDQAL